MDLAKYRTGPHRTVGLLYVYVINIAGITGKNK